MSKTPTFHHPHKLPITSSIQNDGMTIRQGSPNSDRSNESSNTTTVSPEAILQPINRPSTVTQMVQLCLLSFMLYSCFLGYTGVFRYKIHFHFSTGRNPTRTTASGHYSDPKPRHHTTSWSRSHKQVGGEEEGCYPLRLFTRALPAITSSM